MNLRQRAQRDLGIILESDAAGNRWPVSLTDPSGYQSANQIYAHVNDVNQLIDPDTGVLVSARMATLTLRISTLINEGYSELPAAAMDNSVKPWKIELSDLQNNNYVFTVREANPDRTVGLLTLVLEIYDVDN